MIRGKVWKFPDDVNTDYIIPGKYKFKTLDMKELAKHAMEGVDPDFAKKVEQGDIIVAGKNFGMGSSREQAPLVLKYAGVSLVIAEDFARIFYRNSFNVGLPVLICREINEKVDQGDILEADLAKGKIINVTKKTEISASPIPDFLLEMVKVGGLAAYYKKYGRFPWEKQSAESKN
ncbi:MAG: 3-isopropylmalate dehydratase small subunit [Candidatus Jordarchaeum sp.]|uniref:3-isopropylmalate dehydratase small subunit n=1 Tax=Candidatus Jordarchaeum sp. TaxID=2823881 RepID=UPI00404B3DB0